LQTTTDLIAPGTRPGQVLRIGGARAAHPGFRRDPGCRRPRGAVDGRDL